MRAKRPCYRLAREAGTHGSLEEVDHGPKWIHFQVFITHHVALLVRAVQQGAVANILDPLVCEPVGEVVLGLGSDHLVVYRAPNTALAVG